MTQLKASNRDEAKALSEANPQSIVVQEDNGNLWTGPVTLKPVRDDPRSYLCYADHSWDAIGSVRKMPSGLWGAFHYGKTMAMRPTMRDAAIDLCQATK